MQDSPLINKSKQFALQTIKICNQIKNSKKRNRNNESTYKKRNKYWREYP